MKTGRQAAIIALLRSRTIQTQGELAEALREKGYQVTQATVSRDIRELRLVKVSSVNGGYQYALPGQEERNINERMIRILRDSMLQVECAGNMIVVKTLSGAAGSAAEALDTMQWPEVLGSIAGDNTIFLVARSAQEALDLAERIRQTAAQ